MTTPRLTDAELAEKKPVRDSRKIVAEIRAEQAAKAEADRVTLTTLRALIVKHDGDYALDLRGFDATATLALLDRLLSTHRAGGGR